MKKVENGRRVIKILDSAKAFIDSLALDEKEKVVAMLKRLETFPPSAGLVKLVDSENRIYELRGATGDFWIRMFYFQSKIEKSCIITNGYLKKDRRTDPKEIRKAKKIKRTYEAQ